MPALRDLKGSEVAELTPPKMKRNLMAVNGDEDDYVMIKCAKFVFEPTDNKIINFCYSFGDEDDESEEEGEEDGVGSVPEFVETEPAGTGMPVAEAEGAGKFVGESSVPVIFETVPAASNPTVTAISGDAPVMTESAIIEHLPLMADAVTEPVREVAVPDPASSTATVIAPESVAVSNDNAVAYEAALQVEIVPQRSETPASQTASEPPEPKTPEEIVKMRQLKVSEGKLFLVNSSNMIKIKAWELEVEKRKKMVAEGEKMLAEKLNELCMREQMMNQHFMQMEASFNGLVNEFMEHRAQKEREFEQILEIRMNERMDREAREMRARIMFLEQNILDYQRAAKMGGGEGKRGEQCMVVDTDVIPSAIQISNGRQLIQQRPSLNQQQYFAVQHQQLPQLPNPLDQQRRLVTQREPATGIPENPVGRDQQKDQVIMGEDVKKSGSFDPFALLKTIPNIFAAPPKPAPRKEEENIFLEKKKGFGLSSFLNPKKF